MCNSTESTVQMRTCLPENPSVKLDDAAGSVLTIHSNLPQTNAFSAFGYIPVKILKGYFKQAYRAGTNSPPPNPFLDDLNKIAIRKTGDSVSVTYEEENIKLLLKREFPSHHRTDTEFYTAQRTVPTTNYTNGYPYAGTKIEDYTASRSVDMIADKRVSDVVAKLMEFEPVDGVNKRIWTLSISINTFNAASITFEKQSAAEIAKAPQLMIVEEYKVASFLGQYGLGRVLRTFSLLPGEKTTIRLKTYREMKSIRVQSENILDSQSKESTDELERLAQEERGNTSSVTDTKSANLSLSFSIPIIGGGGGAGANVSNTSTRTTNAQALSKALDKHVNKSNSNRQVQINTSTTESTTDTDESSTEREIVNYNKNRVLNFIFRQLQQEYVNITYLSSIKIAFHTGTKESLRVVSLEELGDLLDEVIDPTFNTVYGGNISFIEKELLKNYCQVKNYKGAKRQFLEKADEELYFPANVKLLEGKSYWRKSDVIDVYNDDVIHAPVDGVILNVQKTTLKTSSVLVEALLGQANALDCFNLQIQDSESQKGYMELQEREKRLMIEEQRAAKERDKMAAETDKLEAERAKLEAQTTLISNVIGSADTAAKVELAKEVFGKCCPKVIGAP